MSTILATHGLNFRTAWLDLPFGQWDYLAPAWKARQQLLEHRGEKNLYENDAFHEWSYGFLALQGLAYIPPDSWTLYVASGYELDALLPAQVVPSASAAHDALKGFSAAMEALHTYAKSGQILDPGTFSSILARALGEEPLPRKAPLNGPMKVLSPADAEPGFSALLHEIHNQLSAGASPLAVAAWAHHALTQIRPFADGNARAAFLLTHYILWRGGLPGFYLKPHQRLVYYYSLRQADQGDLRPWASLFLTALRQAVLYTLSWARPSAQSYETAIQTFNQRFADWRTRHDRERSQRIMHNRYTIFDYMEEILRTVASDLDQKLKVEEGRGTRALVAKAYPDSPYYHQFTTDIVAYAREHGYYFNRGLPRGWFKLKFSLSANKKYQLVFSLHHAGHEDATLVVGAFLHFLEPLKYQQKKRPQRRRSSRRKEKSVYLFAPLPFKADPIAFSIENDMPGVRNLLREYVEKLLVQALSILTTEIY